MTTGEKIYNLRKEARITQEEFADKLQVTRQAVSKWESDAAYPETDKIIKIAQMFGVTCDYLLNDAPRYESNLVDKKNRNFLTMMITFSIACVITGLVIALICFYAISEWYCSLVGLGILAGLLLAAFVLWSVGRYKFLSSCNYSEEDKSHLAKLTKAVIYTAIITTFCYLPAVVFCQLKTNLSMGVPDLFESSITVFNKLPLGTFMLSQITFIPTGIVIAKIISLVHDKFLGKEVTPIRLCDAISVVLIALTLTVAYCWAVYGDNLKEIDASRVYHFYADFGCKILFVAFGISSAVILANAIFHKIKENTSTHIFVLQIICAVLLFATIICFNISCCSETASPSNYFNYAFGGLLTIVAFALIALTILQAKKKNYAPLNQLRIYAPTLLFALIQVLPLIYVGQASTSFIIWVLLQCPVFVLPNIIKNK